MRRPILSFAAAWLLVGDASFAQSKLPELDKISTRDFIPFCAVPQNNDPCLDEVYTYMLMLSFPPPGPKKFCPPVQQSNRIPPDIVSRVVTWMRGQSTIQAQNAHEGLKAALMGLYPCP